MTNVRKKSAWLRHIVVFAALGLFLAACPDDEPVVEEPIDEEPIDEEPIDEEPVDVDEDALVIGVVSALEGPFAEGARDGGRALEMALDDFGGEIAGRPVELIIESSDTTPDTAVERSRKLVEVDGVDLVLGPLSGSEGVAISRYAHEVPDVTFVDLASGGVPTTLEDPAPNYFRFHTDGAMMVGGLGTHVVEELGITQAALLAEDYAFGHAQTGGFIQDFCTAGGEVVEGFWVPLGEEDFSSVIAGMPPEAEALYAGFGGSAAVNFLSQAQAFGVDITLIGGSITVDESILTAEAELHDRVLGTVAAGPQVGTIDTPEFQAFVERYREMFPDSPFRVPTLFASLYYNSAHSLLLGLDATGGETGEALQEALRNTSWDSPLGPVEMQTDTQAFGNVFIYEIAEEDGELVPQVIDSVQGVEQGDIVWERPEIESFIADNC